VVKRDGVSKKAVPLNEAETKLRSRSISVYTLRDWEHMMSKSPPTAAKHQSPFLDVVSYRKAIRGANKVLHSRHSASYS